eukprot:SAG31_NODE_4075_length_3612_cov_2.080843_4_plen_75_part_00
MTSGGQFPPGGQHQLDPDAVPVMMVQMADGTAACDRSIAALHGYRTFKFSFQLRIYHTSRYVDLPIDPDTFLGA